MIKCSSSSRHTTRYIGYPLQDPFQGSPQSVLYLTNSFNSWHKTGFRNSFTTFGKNFPRVSHVLSFMFVVYAFELIVKVWFEFIVLVLEVHILFWWLSLTILVVPLYLSFCIYHLSKRHMMCVRFENFTGFLYIIVTSWHFSPGFRLFLFGCNKIIIKKSNWTCDIFGVFPFSHPQNERNKLGEFGKSLTSSDDRVRLHRISPYQRFSCFSW
jgi:hypothetical protein